VSRVHFCTIVGVSTGRACTNNMAQGGDAKQLGKSLSAEIRGETNRPYFTGLLSN